MKNFDAEMWLPLFRLLASNAVKIKDKNEYPILNSEPVKLKEGADVILKHAKKWAFSSDKNKLIAMGEHELIMVSLDRDKAYDLTLHDSQFSSFLISPQNTIFILNVAGNVVEIRDMQGQQMKNDLPGFTLLGFTEDGQCIMLGENKLYLYDQVDETRSLSIATFIDPERQTKMNTVFSLNKTEIILGCHAVDNNSRETLYHCNFETGATKNLVIPHELGEVGSVYSIHRLSFNRIAILSFHNLSIWSDKLEFIACWNHGYFDRAQKISQIKVLPADDFAVLMTEGVNAIYYNFEQRHKVKFNAAWKVLEIINNNRALMINACGKMFYVTFDKEALKLYEQDKPNVQENNETETVLPDEIFYKLLTHFKPAEIKKARFVSKFFAQWGGKLLGLEDPIVCFPFVIFKNHTVGMFVKAGIKKIGRINGDLNLLITQLNKMQFYEINSASVDSIRKLFYFLLAEAKFQAGILVGAKFVYLIDGEIEFAYLQQVAIFYKGTSTAGRVKNIMYLNSDVVLAVGEDGQICYQLKLGKMGNAYRFYDQNIELLGRHDFVAELGDFHVRAIVGYTYKKDMINTIYLISEDETYCQGDLNLVTGSFLGGRVYVREIKIKKIFDSKQYNSTLKKVIKDSNYHYILLADGNLYAGTIGSKMICVNSGVKDILLTQEANILLLYDNGKVSCWDSGKTIYKLFDKLESAAQDVIEKTIMNIILSPYNFINISRISRFGKFLSGDSSKPRANGATEYLHLFANPLEKFFPESIVDSGIKDFFLLPSGNVLLVQKDGGFLEWSEVDNAVKLFNLFENEICENANTEVQFKQWNFV